MEEQNYNMIDGRMNNLPLKPRKIGERISVLDRSAPSEAGRDFQTERESCAADDDGRRNGAGKEIKKRKILILFFLPREMQQHI